MYRVILYGPPLAGKRTLIQSIALRHNAPLHAFEFRTEEWRDYHDAGVDTTVTLGAHAYELLTFSGTIWYEAAWPSIVSRADALVLVLDAQASREDADRRSVKELAHISNAPEFGCVVVTKQDLVAEGVPSVSTLHLVDNSRFVGWPIFYSRCDQSDSAIVPFEWVARQLVSRGERT
jgi:hypothetical protein